MPVEDVDSVKTLLVCSASSKDYETIIFFVVVHRAVGAVRRNVAFGLNLSPFHCDSVEGPKVVHVVGIYMSGGVPA